jgi:hypothetical protein
MATPTRTMLPWMHQKARDQLPEAHHRPVIDLVALKASSESRIQQLTT